MKALPTGKSVESLIQVSQYFVVFFCILKGKKMLSKYLMEVSKKFFFNGDALLLQKSRVLKQDFEATSS